MQEAHLLICIMTNSITEGLLGERRNTLLYIIIAHQDK